MTEKIPGWLERVLLPRLSEMAGEIKAVNVRIEALDEKLSTKIDEGLTNVWPPRSTGLSNDWQPKSTTSTSGSTWPSAWPFWKRK